METCPVISEAKDTNTAFHFLFKEDVCSAKPSSCDWTEMTQAKLRSISWTLSNLTLMDAAELKGQWWKFSSERVGAVNRYLEGTGTETRSILSQMLIWRSEIRVFLRCLMQGAWSGSQQPPCTVVTCPCWLLWRRTGVRTVPPEQVQQRFANSLLGICSVTACDFCRRLKSGPLLWELWLKPLNAVIHDKILFHN